MNRSFIYFMASSHRIPIGMVHRRIVGTYGFLARDF